MQIVGNGSPVFAQTGMSAGDRMNSDESVVVPDLWGRDTGDSPKTASQPQRSRCTKSYK